MPATGKDSTASSSPNPIQTSYRNWHERREGNVIELMRSKHSRCTSSARISVRAHPHRNPLNRALVRSWRQVVAIGISMTTVLTSCLREIRTDSWIHSGEQDLSLLAAAGIDSDTLVLSPLLSPRVDPAEIARELVRLDFKGLYAAIAREIATPEMVRDEIRAFAPDLDFLPAILGTG